MMNGPALLTVKQFNQALNDRDVDGMLACMSPGCVFENTYPPPDGERIVGLPAQRLFWQAFFEGSRECEISIEEIFSYEERVVMRWVYRWVDLAGAVGHIRGVDLYRLENDLIVEKLSYVKG